MARHTEDIDLAMRVLAGPDHLQLPAWQIDLPAPRARRLRDFRVAVWLSSPLSEIDASVLDRIGAAVAAIQAAGASVDEKARAPLGDEEQHRLFMLLLRAATATRWSIDGSLSRSQACPFFATLHRGV